MSKQAKRIWRIALFAVLCIPIGAWLGPGAAAQGSMLHGQVRDLENKPFQGVSVSIKNTEMGQTYEVKTDKNGNYLQAGLRGGVYEITMKVKDTVVYQAKIRIASGEDHEENVNFKDIQAQQGAAATEAQKKAEEESKKFEGVKGHFEAAIAGLEQAKQIRAEMQSTPSDQRGPIREKLGQVAEQAATEFQAAGQAMSETDVNRHVVMAKLGETYEVEGKYEEAAAAYQKAVELRPENAGYYNNLGNILAKLGKIPEAQAAYQKSATIDPPNAANAWRNLGIVLFQSGNYKDAVDPLKKSLDLDPKSAQGWYVLGATLVGLMDTKKEGDKLIPILQPGTVEAYQKCVDLDPNGPYGAQAREGLAQLQAMGLGIETKVKQRQPPKKNQ
jgi:tetratricopeptide (TPR) repeat protein